MMTEAKVRQLLLDDSVNFPTAAVPILWRGNTNGNFSAERCSLESG